MEITLGEPLTNSVFEVEDSNEAIVKARQNGWEVVYPKENQLQIDIDDAGHYQQFQEFLKHVAKHWGPIQVEEHWSKSGAPKRHITVTLGEDVDEKTWIALQASMGSDWRRELFGMIRVKTGDPHPSLLFELPGPLYLGKDGDGDI